MDAPYLGLPAEPDFGPIAALDRPGPPPAPLTLYRALRAPEDHVHFFEPAWRFVTAALERVAARCPPSATLDTIWDRIEQAQRRPPPPLPERPVASWARAVAREFAPVALADGAWLHGVVRANLVECPAGMALLGALMLRFGDPGTGPGRAAGYRALMRSVGIVPESVGRQAVDKHPPCVDVSYERASLGLAIGLFPGALFAETVGVELWMATVGPCPLLARLAEGLGPEWTRWFEHPERARLQALARQATEAVVAADALLAPRILRGFEAADRASHRWERAMLGGAIPRTPREAVVDAVHRKGFFAAGHHGNLRLGRRTIDEMLAGGRAGAEALVDALATSRLVEPGRPAASRLLSQTLAPAGPMFEVFTPDEREAIEAWIAELPDARVGSLDPVEPEAVYVAPHDPAQLEANALQRFEALPTHRLLFHLANADQIPAIRLYARACTAEIIDRVDRVLAELDGSASRPPPYSEAAAGRMLVDWHTENVRWQRQSFAAREAVWQAERRAKQMLIPLDGCWLQGCIDVGRSHHEAVGRLFRIYASEQGDGRLEWNHNRIYRTCYPAHDPKHCSPTTGHALFDAYAEHDLSTSLMRAVIALNTDAFMPEVLGLNLGIEANGVGGKYVFFARRFAADGWAARALDYSLHNGIDNLASGHTRWALSAIVDFMERVTATAPAAVEAEWARIWRMHRLTFLLDHGDEAVQAKLREALVPRRHRDAAAAALAARQGAAAPAA